MSKLFNRILAVIALGTIIAMAFMQIETNWAVYAILAGVIFQASKDDLLEAIRLYKGTESKGS